MKKLLTIFNFLLLWSLVYDVFCKEWNFAITSDLHMGESIFQEHYLQEIVKDVNSKIESYNIKFFSITGDLVSNSNKEEYEKIDSILSKLKVPLFPVIGNHDRMMYNLIGSQEERNGEELFRETFGRKYILNDELSKYFSGHDIVPPVDEPSDCDYFEKTPIFNNYAVELDGYLFLFLDWNDRNQSLFYWGACASTFTINWLEKVFQDYLDPKSTESNIEDIKKIVFVQHQPFRCPSVFFPNHLYCFVDKEKERIRGLITKYPEIKDRYWGVISGHLHYHSYLDTGFLFDEDVQLIVESGALFASYLMVSIDEETGEVTNMERFYTIKVKPLFVIYQIFWFSFLAYVFFFFFTKFGFLKVVEFTYFLIFSTFQGYVFYIVCGMLFHMSMSLGFFDHYFNFVKIAVPPSIVLSKSLAVYYFLFFYFGSYDDRRRKNRREEWRYIYSILTSMSITLLVLAEESVFGMYRIDDDHKSRISFILAIISSFFCDSLCVLFVGLHKKLKKKERPKKIRNLTFKFFKYFALNLVFGLFGKVLLIVLSIKIGTYFPRMTAACAVLFFSYVLKILITVQPKKVTVRKSK